MDTIKFYMKNLNRVKDFIGVGEIKSYKTINDIKKVIRSNFHDTAPSEKLEEPEELVNITEKSIAEIKQESELLKLPVIFSKSNSRKSSQRSSIVMDFRFSKEPTEKSIILDATKTQATMDAELPDEEEDDEYFAEQQLQKINTKLKIEKIKPVFQKTTDSFIEQVLKETKAKSMLSVSKEHLEELDIFEELTERINEAMSDKFVVLMREIDSVCDTCNKYFLSFLFSVVQNFTAQTVKNDDYKIDANFRFENNRIDVLLNSAIKYDNKRLFYWDLIKKSLDNLRILHENFDDDTYEGVSLDDFTPDTQRLCQRFDAHLVPIILIIPEYSNVLKQCIRILNEWLEYDREYAMLIEVDLKELEQRKKRMQSIRHSQKQMYNQLIHRIKTIRVNLDLCAVEFADLLKKVAKKCKWPIEDFVEEKNEQIKFRNWQLLKVKAIATSKYIKSDCKLMLVNIDRELDDEESQLNKFKVSIHTIKPKKSLYKEKLAEMEALESNLNDLEHQLIHYYEIKKLNPNEIIILENCCLKLKEIHMFKNSTDTLRKIHYDLPLPSLKFGLSKDQYVELLNVEADPGEIDETTPIITKQGIIS